MNQTIEQIVKEMNLIPIDDTFRNTQQATYGHVIEEKYKYRTLDGERIYSPEFLLNMSEEDKVICQNVNH